MNAFFLATKIVVIYYTETDDKQSILTQILEQKKKYSWKNQWNPKSWIDFLYCGNVNPFA